MVQQIALHTDRLFVRTYQVKDASDLHQFVKDNTYYLFDTAPMTLRNNVTLARSKAFLEMLERERLAGKWVWNAIFLRASYQFIGQISIYNLEEENRSCELGYFITHEQMGQGFATEGLKAITEYCLQKLHRDTVVLRIKPDNIASKRVAAKAGFRQIGFQEDSFRTYHGNYIDQEVYKYPG